MFLVVVKVWFNLCCDMSDDEVQEKELDLTSPDVVTKYKTAAEILNSYFSSLVSLFLVKKFKKSPSFMEISLRVLVELQRLCSWCCQSARPR